MLLARHWKVIDTYYLKDESKEGDLKKHPIADCERYGPQSRE